MIANLILATVALLAVFGAWGAPAVFITAGCVLTFVGVRLAIWGRAPVVRPRPRPAARRSGPRVPRCTVRRGSK